MRGFGPSGLGTCCSVSCSRTLCGQGEPGIDTSTLWLKINALYLLDHSHPTYVCLLCLNEHTFWIECDECNILAILCVTGMATIRNSVTGLWAAVLFILTLLRARHLYQDCVLPLPGHRTEKKHKIVIRMSNIKTDHGSRHLVSGIQIIFTAQLPGPKNWGGDIPGMINTGHLEIQNARFLWCLIDLMYCSAQQAPPEVSLYWWNRKLSLKGEGITHSAFSL